MVIAHSFWTHGHLFSEKCSLIRLISKASNTNVSLDFKLPLFTPVVNISKTYFPTLLPLYGTNFLDLFSLIITGFVFSSFALTNIFFLPLYDFILFFIKGYKNINNLQLVILWFRFKANKIGIAVLKLFYFTFFAESFLIACAKITSHQLTLYHSIKVASAKLFRKVRILLY